MSKKQLTWEDLMKGYEIAVGGSKSSRIVSEEEERELRRTKRIRKPAKRISESKLEKFRRRTPREVIAEQFAADPNLILEDDVNGLKFKVLALKNEGVEVRELRSGKKYLFPWNIFEL